jgi:type IV pilus assembly protein PilV
MPLNRVPVKRGDCGAIDLRQRGLSLVESLVALLVLSIGMLGIAGLFVESVRSSRSALLRTQAVNLVGDMADRIRANVTARASYDTSAYGGAPEPQDCAPSPESAGGNCTLAQLAEDDLARWVDAVRAALPTLDDTPPVTTVRYFAPGAAGVPERYQITVSWLEPGEPQPLQYSSDVLILPRGPAV